MTTEQEMKLALDGWFFVYNCEKQSVIRRKVPKDHIPAHRPNTLEVGEFGTTAYPWSRDEDEQLIRLRESNLVWTEIAPHFGLSASTVKNRYILLCHMRGVPEFKVNRDRDTYELELRIIDYIDRNLTFAQIAQKMGLSRNQVAGLVGRWKKRNALAGQAA